MHYQYRLLCIQFLGVVAEFEGKRPGQRDPSFVGIHDLAALSSAALVVGALGVALAWQPAGRRWSLVGLVTGALGVALSGAMTAVQLTDLSGTFSLVEGSALPAAVADSNTAEGSLARIPNGADVDDAATDWKFTSTPTPGAANAP
jgi:hypothetical protein